MIIEIYRQQCGKRGLWRFQKSTLTWLLLDPWNQHRKKIWWILICVLLNAVCRSKQFLLTMPGLVQLFNSCFTICTFHWTMVLLSVHIENLCSQDSYGVFSVCASPLPVLGVKPQSCGQGWSGSFCALVLHRHLESSKGEQKQRQTRPLVRTPRL